MQDTSTVPVPRVPQELHVNPWRIFWIFTVIGLQSVGGGASTTLLMQRNFIDKYGWLTEEEFAHLWSLCQLAPGINLVGFTILVGERIGGVPGIFSAVLGLVLPSSCVTCLLAAAFKSLEHLHTTQAIEQGVIPATGAIVLLVGINFAIPSLKQAHTESWFSVGLSIVLILAYTVAILEGVPVALVLVGGGLIGILLFTRPFLATLFSATLFSTGKVSLTGKVDVRVVDSTEEVNSVDSSVDPTKEIDSTEEIDLKGIGSEKTDSREADQQ